VQERAARWRQGARARLEASAFIGRRRGALVWHARQEGGGGHDHGSAWPMGLGRPGGWAGAGAGRAFKLGPNRKDGVGLYFFLFLEIFFCAKINPEISR
jgi:hypothetical protein